MEKPPLNFTQLAGMDVPPKNFARPVKQKVLAQAKGYAYVCKQLLLRGVCNAFLWRSFCVEAFASFYAYDPLICLLVPLSTFGSWKQQCHNRLLSDQLISVVFWKIIKTLFNIVEAQFKKILNFDVCVV